MFPPWVVREMVTKKVTVDDTYGAFYPSIPPGWKGTEFRPPKTDEMYLTSGGARYPEVALHDFDEPRIILKRKELSFEVGDCFEIFDEDKECVVSYVRVERITEGWGRGIALERRDKAGSWVVSDHVPISLNKEGYRPHSRCQISHAKFDNVFIEKIVNRGPA